MADPINLRRARKAKARDEQALKAAQNRVTFGQSKANRSLSSAQALLKVRQLDALLLARKSDDAAD